MANGHGGKRSNAGRKSKADELELQALLDECWTENDRRECIKALIKKTKSGRYFSLEAAKLLLSYAYGKPIDRKEISGKDGEPIMIKEVIVECLT